MGTLSGHQPAPPTVILRPKYSTLIASTLENVSPSLLKSKLKARECKIVTSILGIHMAATPTALARMMDALVALILSCTRTRLGTENTIVWPLLLQTRLMTDGKFGYLLMISIFQIGCDFADFVLAILCHCQAPCPRNSYPQ